MRDESHGRAVPGRRRIIVAAHPDDEVIGAGGQLARWRDGLTIIHLTDGAPRDLRDAQATGFATREAYAAARRAEFRAAMELAGVRPEQCLELRVTDQEASLDLAGLAQRLAARLAEIRPDAVVTHPYEGGHPDHDAAAFAIFAAARLLEREAGWSPALAEMTSYHAAGERMAVGEFLPNGAPGEVVLLSREARQRKRCMLDRFVTQRNTLRPFGAEVERFRPAPHYDFTRPPHEGALYYERFEWGMSGESWRALTGEALRVLGFGTDR